MSGVLRLKARLVLHDSRDKKRFTARRDISAADLSVVKILVSLTALLNFYLATANVKGAYMQSGIIQQNIYVRPLKRLASRRLFKWKLNRLPYGIVEAKRLWLCALETWLLDQNKLYTVSSMEQFHYKLEYDGMIELLVAEVVDNILVSGLNNYVTTFLYDLRKRFELRNVQRGNELTLLGCKWLADFDGNIRVSMLECFNRIKRLPISEVERCNPIDTANEGGIHFCRSYVGTDFYLGHAVLP